MAIEVTVRKWGNSVGIVLPKEIVQQKQIKHKDKIVIDIVKQADLSSLFGTLKTKRSGQSFKDLVRKGWE